MNEQRFNYHIDEVGIYYYICDNTKTGDDRIILEVNTQYTAIEVCNALNNLNNESEQLKKELKSFKPIIFESDGKPVTLYEKRGDVG